jgi:hypothetical protein
MLNYLVLSLFLVIIVLAVLFDNDINNLKLELMELSNFVYDIADKLDNLFKRDRHGTLRPKVDLLDDEFNKFEIDVWNHFRMLQEKIEKLKKTEVDNLNDLSEKTER